MEHFLIETSAAFVGGLLIALALFWLGERVFPVPQFSGRWFVETRIDDTALIRYEGMYLKREVFIWQEGMVLRGSSEKIYEDSSTGKRRYAGVNRSRGSISGVANRYIFGTDRIRLHLEEQSGDRISTSYFDVIWKKQYFWLRILGRDHRVTNNAGLLLEVANGIFQSTAASSSGQTIWSRNRYDERFHSDVREEWSDAYGPIEHFAIEAGMSEPSESPRPAVIDSMNAG